MKLGYILLTLPLLAVSITTNASSTHSQGECYISDPAWATNQTFRTKCSLDFHSQRGENTAIVRIGQDGQGQDGYDLYQHDHIIKIDDDPAYTFYRNSKNLTITDEYDENAMTCFKSEYAEVCYKVDYVESYSEGDYLEIYPKEDYANDDIFHP